MKTAYYLFLIAMMFINIGLAFLYGPTFIILAGAFILTIVLSLYSDGRRNGTV